MARTTREEFYVDSLSYGALVNIVHWMLLHHMSVWSHIKQQRNAFRWQRKDPCWILQILQPASPWPLVLDHSYLSPRSPWKHISLSVWELYFQRCYCNAMVWRMELRQLKQQACKFLSVTPVHWTDHPLFKSFWTAIQEEIRRKISAREILIY